jgi:uncharacterized protein (DUF1330 family)
MPAYVIVQVEITDRERFGEYLKETPRTIAAHGGRYIARAGATETLEGPGNRRRIVVIEFPSMQHARNWYHSPEYREVKTLREGAAVGSIILVDGYAPVEGL